MNNAVLMDEHQVMAPKPEDAAHAPKAMVSPEPPKVTVVPH